MRANMFLVETVVVALAVLISASQAQVELFGTCGGEGHTGPTVCLEGTCVARSKWYWQCRKDCPPDWLCSTIDKPNPPDDRLTTKSVIPPMTFGISEAEFQTAITSNGYPRPSHAQYTSFVSQVQSVGLIKTKREAAMLVAHLIQESGGLQFRRELACIETGCPGVYSTGIGVSGQNYFGRGYIQLSWDYNYLAASMDLFGDRRLLHDADQVAANEDLCWATTFWFWRKNVGILAAVQNGHFGASTNAINGGLECRGAFQHKARIRFEFYKKVLRAFGVNDAPIESGCYN